MRADSASRIGGRRADTLMQGLPLVRATAATGPEEALNKSILHFSEQGRHDA